jgi:hypothetical protein
MGLDTYAATDKDSIDLPDEIKKQFSDADIKLCGGMFSGNGNDGSFRGKVYYELIYEITLLTLYSDWIEPHWVKIMYNNFVAAYNNPTYNDKKDDISNLIKFFKVCVDNNLGLINWW